MANINAQIELKDIDLVKNLIELLRSKYNELPNEIKDAILLIEEVGLSDMDYNAIQRKYGQYEKYLSSFNSDNIVRINNILKKVVYLEDRKEIVAYPEHFWHSFDGFKVVEW